LHDNARILFLQADNAGATTLDSGSEGPCARRFASASLDESIAFGFADPPVVARRAKPDRLLD
jgi:hypothetical protein